MSAHVPQLSPLARAMLPTHVAIIMDGNGRWAKQRHLPRVEGHRHGVEAVRAVVRAAGEIGIKYLTLYAFSVENWNRPQEEVDTLMKYLARFLKSEIGELNRNNVRLEVIWQISYSEFVVTPTLWPDFRRQQFLEAIEEYARRHRRFGGV